MFEPWSASDQPFKNPYIYVEKSVEKIQEQDTTWNFVIEIVICQFIKRFYMNYNISSLLEFEKFHWK